jgi:uncharacterized protein YndB with AHSA1/START domain
MVTYYAGMEEVFRALADPSRRLLLDRLFERDGQTLRELEAHLPEMSRFGVMKHLRVLSDAHLVVARRSGREKHHFLNPVPIQDVYDRWVSKFARPWTRALTGLRASLEETPAMTETMIETPDRTQTTRLVHEIYIRTTPERLFAALTDGELTRQYYMGTRVQSDWVAGSGYTYAYPNGETMIDGQVLEIDPPKRLVLSFHPLFTGHDTGTSRVTHEIEQIGDVCRLTLIHDDLDPQGAGGINSGWAQILSSLKSLLETGQALDVRMA